MAIDIGTKRINALQAVTDLLDDDNIVVELAQGGTKRMTYGSLLLLLTNAIVGTDSKVLTVDDIATVMTDSNDVIPSAKLLYDMNEIVQVALREQRCINNGEDGIVWDIDELMDHVAAGRYYRFAIGDCIIDNGKHWRIFAKKFFPGWSFYGTITNEPNHVVMLPDEALGQHVYNTSATNVGGYAGSLMPAYLENEILPTLSAKLRSYILPTEIYENNKNGWAATMRNMRIPTVIECTGNQGWADQFSGGICSQLPLMRAMRHRIKNYWYWCLDPVASNTTDFCLIHFLGASTYDFASYSYGSVRPEIVLSKAQ